MTTWNPKKWVNSKGMLHREDNLPALINDDGHIAYLQNGMYHRMEGPALIWSSGKEFYWIFGCCFSKKRFEQPEYLTKFFLFRVYAKRWIFETSSKKFEEEKYNHPDYVRITEMNELAIEFILRWYRSYESGDWNKTLLKLTGKDKPPPSKNDSPKEIMKGWIEWADKTKLFLKEEFNK